MKIRRMISTLVLGGVLSSPLTAIEKQVSYELPLPEAKSSEDILPTPIRVLMRTTDRVSVRTDFVGGDATLYSPLYSVIEGEEYDDRGSFTTNFHDLTDKRFERTVSASDRFNITYSRRSHETGSFYVELGGQEVFFDYPKNYLSAFSTPSGPSIEIPISLIELDPEDQTKDLESVSYRFFDFDSKLVKFFARKIRKGYSSEQAYWQTYVRRWSPDSGVEKGLRGNGPWIAYVFNTCLSFRELGGAVDKPEFDSESLCWIYDLSQLSELLPYFPSESLNPRSSHFGKTLLVERVLRRRNSEEVNKQYQLTSLPKDSSIQLSSTNWQDF